jgi:hypothetical protein
MIDGFSEFQFRIVRPFAGQQQTKRQGTNGSIAADQGNVADIHQNRK